MPDEDKTFGGSLVLDWRIWWRHMHTLYKIIVRLPQPFFWYPAIHLGGESHWKSEAHFL